MLDRGVIYEGIITYYLPNGEPTAAPMGFELDEENVVVVRPYRGTRTYDVLRRYRRDCVINLILDPEVYLMTAFKHHLSGLQRLCFRRSPYVDAPRLCNAYGYLDLKLLDFREGHRGTARFAAVNIEVQRVPFVYTRALMRALEAIIYATKAVYADDVQLRGESCNEVRRSVEIVRRTDGGGRYLSVVKKLVELLKGMNVCSDLS